MDKAIGAIVIVAIIVVVFSLMALSWRRRRRRQDAFDAVVAAPASEGRALATAGGLYLATTPRGDRLDRVVVGGLGFRARLAVSVHADGVRLPLPDGTVLIPAADLIEVGTASWAIDRGMEPGGITVVSWRLGDRDVESFLRFDEPGPVVAAIQSLIPIAATQNGGDPQ
ncbi:hypothetical protein QT381_13510 [Galbitalea sp. SE-J8]|uniref:PH-like domain-containing protein n=1 Tax=Galbitalea sp. SE-J8 TaxID=3054952 RepID=UPI00259C9C25|nr:hypothetical protein [Galbitalea sp. SE-J8]MDM4764027.1 hypothetical protein [Galbitalea sp. SE-J8]